ncbi:HPr family phosphocarrier protein [Flavimobilis sp. GY10621]|uniref:Phosphocarrier protein HPr n=1 Tax=Flavimobilis rhizosphaerae TaxID=2775421 RepID=A0ABR9DNI6_9MICO|nr:HPr family phosphocarrier protein [Flavimobilis rhizosphaerae]MBD9698685.1 HPr family phosphocarrier protein [Flavimobilis rhizosphaerae]
MHQRTVTVGSASGLHARPAALLAAAAAGLAPATVLIARPGSEGVDASSVLMLMTLGVGHGETVELSSDDEGALDTVAELVAADLDAR